ncbi:MAG: tRNA uridine-5-carboxymethylaminomethyl(34) synthesis GTPase MnmE [Clostridiales bacterium]|nr:tRNA uridine-5-carboxymethylaminomethyl(34) synthesis GTPase MnmE [Clostridiales bacterium]
MQETTTIAAISTPYGKGGVALIRISGPDAVSIASNIFYPKGCKTLSAAPANTAVYGIISSDGNQIDDGIATVFYAPRSFTGENTVEISCHGGIFVTEQVLRAAFEAGAVPAGPGEFTKRAFLNGKLGLTQAEAIADVLDAHSEEMLKLSSAGSRGVLGKEIERLSDAICSLIAETYVNVDFPDEDLSYMDKTEMTTRLDAVLADIETLEKTYKTGRAIREGIETVIAGKPNTGKSSLLNLMCGTDRAIVTDIAGTTRDLLEEKVIVGKITLNLCDTAGIRSAKDAVEKIGVEKAEAKIEKADLILAVFDSSSPLDRFDADIINRINSLSAAKIAIINKSDLPSQMDPYQIESIFDKIVYLSAATGEGKEELFSCIEELYTTGEIDYNTTAVIANARQHAAIKKATSHVKDALRAIHAGYSDELAASALELALGELAEIDGRQVSEQIVNEIFHHFCVGK